VSHQAGVDMHYRYSVKGIKDFIMIKGILTDAEINHLGNEYFCTYIYINQHFGNYFTMLDDQENTIQNRTTNNRTAILGIMMNDTTKLLKDA
jgi:hypothetical protein